jgi:FSR family fosmidomycin resistance protein-like MFS transporter
MAIGNITGLIGGLLPFCIGLAADAFGLQKAIWLLLAGPVVLLVGLPRHTATIND